MNVSFKTKLHSLFIMLMVIFIVLSTVISYVVSKQLIINNMKASNESELLLSMQTMQNLMQKSKEQFRLFVEDYKPTIHEWVTDRPFHENLDSYNRKMISDILAFLYTNKEFTGMYIVNNEQLIGTSLNTQLITKTTENPLSGNLAASRKYFKDLLIHNGQFPKDSLTEENMQLIPINEGAFIVAVLDLQNLALLNNVSLTYINNKEQVVFSSGEKQEKITTILEPKENRTGTIYTYQKNQQIDSSYTTDKQERYVLIHGISQLSDRFGQIIWIVIALSLLLILLFAIVSNKVAIRILSPIYDFINKLKQIKGYEDRQLMKDYISSYKGQATVAGHIFKYYFLIIIPVSIVIVVSFLSFDKIIESNSKQDLHNIINKTKDGIENNIRSYTFYIRYLSLDREFQSLMLLAGNDETESYHAAFSDLLVRKGILNKEISTVAIYNANNRLIYSNVSQPNGQQFLKEKVSGVSGYARELEIVKNELDSMPPVVMMKKSILSLLDPTEELKKFDYMGFIELGIQNIFTSTNLLPANEYAIHLLDKRGQSFPLTTSMENRAKKTTFIQLPLEEDKLQLEVQASNDWNKQKYVFILLYSIEIACMLLIMIWISSHLGRRMTAPIVRAIQVMEIYPEQINARLDSEENEFEFIVLAKNFNQMLARLEQLTDELTLKELENVSLERRIHKLIRQALQAQINPHFLHNIFTSIMMLVKSGKNDKAANMLVDTAEFLKSGLYGTSELVRLQNELDHVNAYMKLQNIRHENQLKLVIDVDEPFKQIHTPKFILQPIVENSIHHGLEKDRLLTIRIQCYLEGPNTLNIVIIDDGKGMSPERFNEISDQLEKRTQTAHYGLSNVHERIYLEFGPPYGLLIEQSMERGTIVSIKLPYGLEGN
ncbi:sensor histidine kinase [Paenibacillus agaridevorans]|uniref:sensor histidine kinase n=1 Tax=Paenibacillus agaridevorans TaxID=171404 RepID=UPI001BE438A5|nr:histidine kinase [Paenibacillus agaridevorans]